MGTLKISYPLEMKDVRRLFCEIPGLLYEGWNPEQTFVRDPPLVLVLPRQLACDFYTPLGTALLKERNKSINIIYPHDISVRYDTPCNEDDRSKRATCGDYGETTKLLWAINRIVHGFAWEGIFEINDERAAGANENVQPKSLEVIYTRVAGEGLVAFCQADVGDTFVTTEEGMRRIFVAARKANRDFSQKAKCQVEEKIRQLRTDLKNLRHLELGIDCSLQIERKFQKAK